MADEADALNSAFAGMMGKPAKVKMSEMPAFDEPIEDHENWMHISFTSDVDDDEPEETRNRYNLYVPEDALTNEIHAACLNKCGQQLSCGYTKIVLLDDTGFSIHEGDPTSGGGAVNKKISEKLKEAGFWEPGDKLELKIITFVPSSGFATMVLGKH